jgi:tetratricopeptide (TPR) repeat protein
MGYEPVSAEVNVAALAPGAPPQTVSLSLLRQRVIAPDARGLRDEGESIWLKSNPTASNLQKEADFFSRALQKDSNYSQAALGLCRVLEAQGKVRDGLSACRRAIEIDSDFVEARTMTGVLLMDSGNYQEAVRQIQQAATQDPENSYAESLLAEALFLADRPEEAEKEAAKAVSLNPASAQAFLMRAEARRIQGKYDEAIDDYNRALRDDEFESSIGRKIAFWAIGTGMQKSSNGYRFLYNSQKASAYYGLCGAELGRENYLRAVRDCNASLEAEKDDPETLILRAECYKALFNSDTRREYLVGAQNDLKSALRLNSHIDGAPKLQQYLKEIEDTLKHVAEDRAH